MNKNKIIIALSIIIVLLIMGMSIMTYKYLKMKDSAKENLQHYLEVNSQLYKLQHPDAEINSNIDELIK